MDCSNQKTKFNYNCFQESDLVTVSTHFRHLDVATTNDEDPAEGDDPPVTVRVDLRNLSLFLGADHIAPKRVLVLIQQISTNL